MKSTKQGAQHNKLACFHDIHSKKLATKKEKFGQSVFACYEYVMLFLSEWKIEGNLVSATWSSEVRTI